MSSNLFNSVQYNKPDRNTFDLTHDVKTSFNMGELIPVCIMECIPGDKFHISTQTLLRFQPLIAPVMHRMDLYVHYFFVPHRIIWNNWQYWISGENDPSTLAPCVFPTLITSAANTASGTLADYLGVPFQTTANTETISALPFAAYQRIHYEYYRDENLINTVTDTSTWAGNTVPRGLADGPQGIATGQLTTKRLRAWEHDYFTSALPFAQKGNAVSLPLGDVLLKPAGAGAGQTTAPWIARIASNHNVSNAFPIGANTSNQMDSSSVPAQPLVWDPNGTLSVGSTTINDLRRAYRLQEYLEKNARGGTRYIEWIKAHFGVASSDARLQRPQYITGMKVPVMVSEVVNTGGDTATIPQGNMAGHGLSAGAGKIGSHYCEEHGYIMGIMSVMPKTAYFQGIPRHFLKGQLGNQTNNGAFDFFTPEFAHIGEQAVQNNEIYAYQVLAASQGVFGYVPRYAEYKFEPSRVSGDFRTTLSFWHLARNFSSAPALNRAFVEAVPSTNIWAVTAPVTQHLLCHILNQVKVSRLMPKFGTPTM